MTYAMDRAESARQYDLNGWFEVSDNPISREGIFPYSGAQVGHPDTNRIFRVYRPAEELSDPETLASFRLMPIIEDHVMLGEGFTPAEEKGVAGVIGEKVSFKDGIMAANLKIYSKALAEKIKNGKTELSCGYRCVYDFTSGVWNGQAYDVIQRRIRANHLAVVDEGRMGPEVAILDRMTFTADAKETSPVDEELKKALEAMAATIADLSTRLSAMEGKDEDEEAEVKVEAEDEEAEVEVEAEDEEVEAKVEAMDAVLKGLRKQVSDLNARPVMDEKLLLKTLAEKNDLVERLKPFVGVFDHAAMTYSEVAEYGVQKLGIKNAPKGSEAVALDAYLQAAKPATPHVALDRAEPTTLDKAIGAYVSGAKK